MAVLKRGRPMDVDAKDCRFDRFASWLRVTHRPTGVTVESRKGSSSGVGPEGERRLIEKLRAAVTRHLHAESAETSEAQCLVFFRLPAAETRGSLVSFQDERARRQVQQSLA